MRVEDKSNSGGYLVIDEITDEELQEIKNYCDRKNLRWVKYPNFNWIQIILWRSRPFTKSGNFTQNGFFGKAQQHACNQLSAEVIEELGQL